MGLQDRLKAYQQEQAAKQAAEAEAARKTAREQQLKDLAIEQVNLAQEIATRARILATHSPLLEVINARGQLEELSKVWGVGKVDLAPSIGSDWTSETGKYDYAKLGYSYDYPVYIPRMGCRNNCAMGECCCPPLKAHVSITSQHYSIAVRKTDNTSAFRVNWATGPYHEWQKFDPQTPSKAQSLLSDVIFDYLKDIEETPKDIIAKHKREVRKHGLALPGPFQPWYRRILG